MSGLADHIVYTVLFDIGPSAFVLEHIDERSGE